MMALHPTLSGLLAEHHHAGAARDAERFGLARRLRRHWRRAHPGAVPAPVAELPVRDTPPRARGTAA
jgi:hypothetical protein